MISGGSIDGDSNLARKVISRKDCLEVDWSRRNEPVISFGPEDLSGVSLPHNDGLVIQARVANYVVMRVFVDNGSSVNVIFKEDLVQMDLQGYQLEAVDTALFGFAGHAVYPEGEIILPLTLGTGELRKTELIGISPQVAEHKLNIIRGSRPINQKKRHFGTEKYKVIDEQVQELLCANHIREGYHQIPIVREDQDKARFVTSGGTFCYLVMSFGLKNVEATYQRLMNQIFQKLMGRNVEV
ncbi:uncharacterized protein LOC142520258 [Primulina tabacum]|uniref:uncharacterized protein LOC142520258 n=1 Tax=Primulina tabacum TaxID=48773 RepID=UPI003F592817